MYGMLRQCQECKGCYVGTGAAAAAAASSLSCYSIINVTFIMIKDIFRELLKVPLVILSNG